MKKKKISIIGILIFIFLTFCFVLEQNTWIFLHVHLSCVISIYEPIIFRMFFLTDF